MRANLGLHPSHRQPLRSVGLLLALLLLGLPGALLLPPLPGLRDIANYLPLHTLLETLAVVVAMLVFAVGWNAFRRGSPRDILLLAYAFFAVGIFDCAHMLSYAGMPDFLTPNHPEKGIHFWLLARTVAAVALLAVSLSRWDAFPAASHRYRGLLLSLALTLAMCWLVLFHGHWLPRTFIPGQGLTPFKIYYEYALVALYLAAALVLLLRMRGPLPFNAPMLFSAVCIMALSELFFTLYSEVTDVYNLLGHVYKAISYLFLYRAIFVEAIEHPYSLLQSTKHQLQFLADNAPIYIVQYDRDKRYRFINRPYAALFGLRPEDVLGRHAREVLGEEAYAAASPHMDMALGGRATTFDLVLGAAPGSSRTLLVRYVPERDAAGVVVGFIAAISDITERKQAEETISRTKDLLQSIIEHVPLRIFWKDGALRYLGANTLLARDAGYAEVAAIIGKTDYEMPWRAQAGRYRADDQAVMDSGMPRLDFEEPQTTPDGRSIWLSTSKVPLRDTDGSIIGVLGLYQDITARRQAEADLRKLSLAVEQSPNSIAITDLDARIEYVNEMFVQQSGYAREEVMGQNPRILQSGKTPREIYRAMWSQLLHGETWRGELINRRKDGTEYIESVQISPVRQADGRITHYLAIKENITERKRTEQRIESLAHYDQLTGLPNRALLNERFRYAFSLAQRNNTPLAVMFMDLDHFKNVNDTLGHSVGDQLLVMVAERIQGNVREGDTVSRSGGDEFVLVLPNTHEEGAAHVASKLIEVISQPCRIQHHELVVTPSIGIAIYPEDGGDFETLSKNADAAMYRVKQGGRNGFCFYTPEMQQHSARSLQLASALRHALARDELQLYYQPQVSLADGRIVGAEALLRWQHPELGWVSPAEFIPIAEDGGQIIPIGEWVIRTAAGHLKAWKENGVPGLMLAVNLSAVQFRQANIAERVTHILDATGLPHDCLELELTEAVAMDDPLAAIEVMDKLHAHGIRLAIDDFGTGYSSLSHLKKFKVAKLKIDQSFVRDITVDPEDKAIVSAIINMAASLGMRTIAEGVETASQLDFLRAQGCDEVQGYYFSAPLPAQQFEAYLKRSGGYARPS